MVVFSAVMERIANTPPPLPARPTPQPTNRHFYFIFMVQGLCTLDERGERRPHFDRRVQIIMMTVAGLVLLVQDVSRDEDTARAGRGLGTRTRSCLDTF